MEKCPKCGSIRLSAVLAADSQWSRVKGKWTLTHWTLFEERAQIMCNDCGYEEEDYLPLTTDEYDTPYYPGHKAEQR